MDRDQFRRTGPPRRRRGHIGHVAAAAVATATVMAMPTKAGADEFDELYGCTADLVEGYLQQYGVAYALNLFTSDGYPEVATEWWLDDDGVWQIVFESLPVDENECEIVVVPDVVGLTLVDAVSILDEVGLDPQPDSLDGDVAEQTPLAWSYALYGDWVDLVTQPQPQDPAPQHPRSGQQQQPPPPTSAPPEPQQPPPSPAAPQPPGPPATQAPQQPRPSPAPPGTPPGGGALPTPGGDGDTTHPGVDLSPAAHRSPPAYAWAGLCGLVVLGLLIVLLTRSGRRRHHHRRAARQDVRVHLRRWQAVYRMASPADPTGAAGAARPLSIRVVRGPALVTIDLRLPRRQPA